MRRRTWPPPCACRVLSRPLALVRRGGHGASCVVSPPSLACLFVGCLCCMLGLGREWMRFAFHSWLKPACVGLLGASVGLVGRCPRSGRRSWRRARRLKGPLLVGRLVGGGLLLDCASCGGWWPPLSCAVIAVLGLCLGVWLAFPFGWVACCGASACWPLSLRVAGLGVVGFALNCAAPPSELAARLS